jgi:glycosyltransferase involved in cell wall biosynthesis
MFSVVIPLYNKEDTILRTLYSVITQTYTDFEVVIVDDGSKDRSVERINAHINDHRIRLIGQSNQGVSIARNRGVAEAKYPYIAFLDADDEWLPTYLEKVVEAIALYPDAGMYCTPALHRSIVTGHGKYYIKESLKGEITEINYFKDPKVLGGQTSGVVVSKAVFDDLKNNYEGQGFPPGLNLNEDWACFQSIALISQCIYIGFSLSIRNVDVVGQLVDLKDEGLDMRLNKTPVYLNITLRNYLKSGKYNKSFEQYRNFEIRSTVSFFVRKGYDLNYVAQFIDTLDSNYSKLLPEFEMKMYKHSNKYVILAYLIFTKIVYKLNNMGNS